MNLNPISDTQPYCKVTVTIEAEGYPTQTMMFPVATDVVTDVRQEYDDDPYWAATGNGIRFTRTATHFWLKLTALPAGNGIQYTQLVEPSVPPLIPTT